MITRFVLSFLSMILIGALSVASAPVAAQSQDNTMLTRLDTDNPEAFAFFNALGIYDFIRIVAEESVSGADQIRLDFFPELPPEAWEAEMRTLFSPEAIATGFEAAWNDEALDAEARAEVMAFFTSDLGQRVVAAEITAREGMADPNVAEAARSAVTMAARDRDVRLEAFADFSAALDLVDQNVATTMNAQVQFLTALSDAGVLQPPLPQEELLRFVGAQLPELRVEAEEWLMAYHLMAYGSLSADEFEIFAAANTSDAGQALTAAVLQAFDEMFLQLQYALGQAAAQHAIGDDI